MTIISLLLTGLLLLISFAVFVSQKKLVLPVVAMTAIYIIAAGILSKLTNLGIGIG